MIAQNTNTVINVLSQIQHELSVPKGQTNSFGGYKYRSCEDILEALKPLLKKYECNVTLTDEIVIVGTRYYVKAVATLQHFDGYVHVSAFAREAETKKGMDESQITGAASSYARKYALNGLFCIDDTKDADSTNTHDKPADKVTDKELGVIRDSLAAIEEKEDDLVKKVLKINRLEDLLMSDYQRALNAIQARKKAKEQAKVAK